MVDIANRDLGTIGMEVAGATPIDQGLDDLVLYTTSTSDEFVETELKTSDDKVVWILTGTVNANGIHTAGTPHTVDTAKLITDETRLVYWHTQLARITKEAVASGTVLIHAPDSPRWHNGNGIATWDNTGVDQVRVVVGTATDFGASWEVHYRCAITVD